MSTKWGSQSGVPRQRLILVVEVLSGWHRSGRGSSTPGRAERHQMLYSTTRVVTHRPHRYIKQLVSHMGRKVPTALDEDRGTGCLNLSSVTSRGHRVLRVDDHRG
ncbi:DUF2218 domain-containing protein [Micromonospora globbae]|uniref:DUF2218 domain-containing protein n=1 Tax=Micromonospora globbae TaxID=1894969 RepID=UPI0037A2BBE9